MNAFNFSFDPKNKLRRKNIFISYREKDTAGETGRLVDSLKQHFYEDQIFLDIDKIEPGVDFTDVIAKSLESCDVMLAVIGPNWAAKNAANNTTRINDPNDWVRLEIATALKRNIRVVPVLVDGGTLPPSDELPEDLQPLLRRQAYEISTKRWKYDTDQLVGFLEKSVGIPPKHIYVPEKPLKTSGFTNGIKWVLIIAGALFILLLILYGVGNENNTQTQQENNAEKVYSNNEESPGTSVNSLENSTNNGAETEQKKQPVENPQIEHRNVEGTWDDANGLYYLVMTQDGEQVDVMSYGLTGAKTGEGLGTVNGPNLLFKLNIINFGILSAKAKISTGENDIKGTTTIESNGAVYSEPLHLRKR